MDITHLSTAIEEHLALAREASAGRHSVTLVGDRTTDLRQTLITLAEGHRLNDHEAPGEATLLVLKGRVRFFTGAGTVELGEGDHLVIPPERHGLAALTDAAVLLTVATRA